MGLPAAVYQIFFAVNFLNCMVVTWILCKLIHMIPFVGSKKTREGYCVRLCNTTFYYLMVKPCPWVRIHGMKEFYEISEQMKGGSAPFLIANHNSKFDSLMITGIFPAFLAFRMRSLIKLALFKEPLFGGICSAVGHFPVYFKGSNAGDFSVDKEAQKKVAEDMDAFLSNGGGLLLFPEGQLNKNPRTLQSFRHGSFTVPIAQKRAIWAFINVGCEKSWPYTAPMGGIPTDIYVKAFKITDDASKFERVELAEHALKLMQVEIDKLYELADKNRKAN